MAVTAPNAVAISNGESVVKAGSTDELTVQSGNTNVVLQSNAVAVIDSKTGGMMTVTSLSDANPDGVDVKVEGQSYHIKPGEQLLIGKVTATNLSGGVPESGTNLTGGAQQSTSALKGGASTQNPVYVLKAAVDLPEYLPKRGVILQCRECAFANYVANKTTQPAAQVAGGGEGAMLPTNVNDDDMSLNKGHDVGQPQGDPVFSPVAYSSTITTALPKNIVISGSAELVPVGADHFRLRRGNALIQAKHATRVDTELLSVFAKPGAILLVTDSRQLSRVRELCDKHTGDVKILVGNSTLQLSPGKEISVSRMDTDALPQVFADGLARRNIHEVAMGKFKIITDDFSILNALMNHPLLHQLRQSKDVLDAKTMDDIQKVAAILSLVSDRYKGPYFGPEVRPGTGIAAKPVEPIY